MIGVKAWVDWAIWLLWRYNEGIVDLPSGLLWRRLRVCPVFYPLLGFFCIWAISGDMPFVFSMEEIILSSQPWFLVFVLALLLIVFFAFVLLLRCFVLFCLGHLLPLLATPLLLYVENLLIRRLLRLWLALPSVAPLSVPAISLVLLVLILFF